MAEKSKMVAMPTSERATPLEAGDAVEHPALSQMGATFAERAAARKKAEARAMRSADAEDKAVASATSKFRKK